VRSLDRALALLEHVADAGGAMRLGELEALTGLPLPTVHRLVRALVDNGYLLQEPTRSYALGPRLIRLGEIAGRRLGSRAESALIELAGEIGESANLALLDHDRVVYVAQAPSRQFMRMFTEVGRRVYGHCTGVGKAVLAQLPDDEVLSLLRRTGMPARTARTHTDPTAFLGEIAEIREQGWAMDDGEEEAGVRCVAVPVRGTPIAAAMSVSAPSGRLTTARAVEIAPILQRAAQRVEHDLSG